VSIIFLIIWGRYVVLTEGSYFLTLTSFQPLYGKLSDIFGRKPALLFAYAVFGLGCLFCGLARNLKELVAARAFAGELICPNLLDIDMLTYEIGIGGGTITIFPSPSAIIMLPCNYEASLIPHFS
jgi:MFS family permease